MVDAVCMLPGREATFLERPNQCKKRHFHVESMIVRVRLRYRHLEHLK